MAHPLSVSPSAHGHIVVTDNYYTPHAQARELWNPTNGEVRTLGTVWKDNLDAVYRQALKAALHELEHTQRGDGGLCQALYAPSKSFTPSHCRHSSFPNMQGGVSDPTPVVADRTGYIVWKDGSTVDIYCNALAESPTAQEIAPCAV